MDAHIKAQRVEWFNETKSDVTVQRRFGTKYNINRPSRPSISVWYETFLNTGSLYLMKGKGRQRVSDKDVWRVQQTFMNSPNKSTRCELYIKHSTVTKFANP